jgi:subtilase family serine protease
VNGTSCYFVGTSGVAPLYAGLIAVLQSAFGAKFGFLNPTLYQLGTSSNTPFNDVTNGNNDSGDTPDSPYFTATTGWVLTVAMQLSGAIIARGAHYDTQHCQQITPQHFFGPNRQNI